MKIDFIDIGARHDERGFVIEMLTNIVGGAKEVLYIVTAPGALRGNHYHESKKEVLCFLSGKATLAFEDNSTKEKKVFVIDADKKPSAVFVPVNVTHSILNSGVSNLVILEVSNQLYGENPDTFKKDIS
jgi:UDP-2-acetamido-2,6-beta-L-arabino-hexul-4-ose reductase